MGDKNQTVFDLAFIFYFKLPQYWDRKSNSVNSESTLPFRFWWSVHLFGQWQTGPHWMAAWGLQHYTTCTWDTHLETLLSVHFSWPCPVPNSHPALPSSLVWGSVRNTGGLGTVRNTGGKQNSAITKISLLHFQHCSGHKSEPQHWLSSHRGNELCTNHILCAHSLVHPVL